MRTLNNEHCSHFEILLSTTVIKFYYKLFTVIQQNINIPIDVFRATKSSVAEELDDSSCELPKKINFMNYIILNLYNLANTINWQ